MIKESITEKWNRGVPTLGIWCEIPSIYATEVVARVGFDWGCVDWQHGLADRETTSAMLGVMEAHGAAAFVRVSSTTPAEIGVALDIGARGVIVPMVESREQAEEAIAHCLYPPEGLRSIGPMRVSPNIGVFPSQANKNVACVLMVETANGLDRIGEIADARGIGAVFIGPGDLQLSLGNSPTEPLRDEVLDMILRACKQAGVPAGIYASSPDDVRRLAEAGFVLIAVTSDRELLAKGAVSSLRALRAESSTSEAANRGIFPVLGSDFSVPPSDEGQSSQ